MSNDKVYGEITLRYWVDVDAYTQMGMSTTAARALEMAHDVIPEIVAADFHDDDVEWRGIEVLTPQPFLLNDRTRRELKKKYDEWRAAGAVLSDRENSCKADERVDSDEWHAHDDAAKELYGELASYLFELDECGHQAVTVTRDDGGEFHAQCDGCPTGWAVRS